jgi:ABC-type branched-subunit amino acid transport system substrate-binding protein
MIHRIFIPLMVVFFLISCSGSSKNIQVKKLDVHVDVAIMLPLSGTEGHQSMKLLKLIKQGLTDGAKVDITPITYDCTTENMTLAAINDIAQKNIKIIIGPLFSATTSMIKKKAKEHGITILTFSNNPALADANTYVFGHAPVKQMERLVKYHLDHGYNNYFVLLPSGAHSVNLSKIIENMVNAKDGTLVKAEFYSAYEDSINKAVRNISDAVDILNEDIDNSKKPVIYIGDYEENLPLLFDKFYSYSLDSKAEIIGDSRINILFDKPINLTYTGSLNIEDTDLKERFKFLVGTSNLNYLEGLAYDLALITANAIGTHYHKPAFIAKLDDYSGYMGVTGIVRFNKKLAERKYDIIKRVGKKHKVIDFAGEKF